MTQQYCLFSMAAWLSSTGNSHHNPLLHFPSIHLSTVNSRPCTGIVPQSLTPAPSRCTFQETHVPAWRMYGCDKDCLILIPFRLPHISCFILSLKCHFWLRQLPWHGDQTDASVPPPAKGRSSPTNIPVFPLVPSSYRVLCVSIYSFLLVRHSCPLSAGVSACTSVSEGVFLMYSWREMYSTYTYLSAIFKSPLECILK